MKKYIRTVFLLLILVGCEKREFLAQEQNEKEIVCLNASFGEDTTKVVLQDDNLLWESGDKLTVFSSSTPSGSKEYTTTQSGNYATFYGEKVTKSEGAYYCAVYPPANWTSSSSGVAYTIPNIQPYVKDGIARGVVPMFAIGSECENMKFKMCGSVLRFGLKVNSETAVNVDKVEVIFTPWSTYTCSIAGQVPLSSSKFKEYYDKHSFLDIFSNLNNHTITLDVPDDFQLNRSEYTQINVVVNPIEIRSLIVRIHTTAGDVYQLVRSASLKFTSGCVYDFGNVTLKKAMQNDVSIYVDGDNVTEYSLTSDFTFNNSVKICTKGERKISASEILTLICKSWTNKQPYSIDLSEANYYSTSWDVKLETASVVYLPNSLTKISGGFLYDRNLQEVHIPEGVTTVGNTVFYGLSKAFKIYIPSSVSSFGTAVYPCEKFIVDSANPVLFTDEKGQALYRVPSVSGGPTTFISYASGSSTDTFTIPENVLMSRYSFAGAENLRKLIICDNVNGLTDNSLFQYVTKLQEIEFIADSPTIKTPSDQFGCPDIGKNTKGDKIIHIPSGTYANYSNFLQSLTANGWTVQEVVIVPASAEQSVEISPIGTTTVNL